MYTYCSSSLSALLVTTYFFFIVFICWLSAVQERVTGYSQLVNSFCLPRCQLGMCNYSRWSWKISQHCTNFSPFVEVELRIPIWDTALIPRNQMAGKQFFLLPWLTPLWSLNITQLYIFGDFTRMHIVQTDNRFSGCTF